MHTLKLIQRHNVMRFLSKNYKEMWDRVKQNYRPYNKQQYQVVVVLQEREYVRRTYSDSKNIKFVIKALQRRPRKQQPTYNDNVVSLSSENSLRTCILRSTYYFFVRLCNFLYVKHEYYISLRQFLTDKIKR